MNQLPVLRGEAPEKLAEALKKFAGSPELPHSCYWQTAGGSAGGSGGALPIVKKAGTWEISRARAIFSSVLDTRDGVTVLHHANTVAALEAGALLDVPLRKLFLFPDGA